MTLKQDIKLDNYALAILKPDVLEHFLEEQILDLFTSQGLEVAKRKIVTLTTRDACEFYWEKHLASYFKQLIDFMTSGESMFLVVRCQDGGDATYIAKQCRDQARKELKLIRYELAPHDTLLLNSDSHPLQWEITREMALRNLVHVADSFRNMISPLSRLLSYTDLDDLRERENGLYKTFVEAKRSSLAIEVAGGYLSRERAK